MQTRPRHRGARIDTLPSRSPLHSTNALTVGLVILTTGDRTDELSAITRAAGELDFDQRLIVGNGCRPPQLDGWQAVESAENLGVPGGRSLGMSHATTDIVVFLDDDSSLRERSSDLVDRIRRVFATDATIGAVAFRVVVTGTDTSLRRWSPTPTRSASRRCRDVPTFPGNGHALRRCAFWSVGGYLDALFFKHEETELSWRLLDNGWRVVLDPTIVVEHPATTEARHAPAIELGLRNKIWIARLRLPALAATSTVIISILRTVARCRSTSDLRAAATGFRHGTGALPEKRNPIGWRTVWNLTRAGRPPIF